MNISKVKCPFCDRNMSEVVDSNYPKLVTFLCYGCGYSIDECLMENKELLEAYERIFFHFQKVLKPKNLDRFKPSTESKHDKDYRQGNRTCVKVLYKRWDIIQPVLDRDMESTFNPFNV